MSPRQAGLGTLLLGLALISSCSDTIEPEIESVPLWGPVRVARLQATENASELLLSWIPPAAKEGLPALQRYEIVHSRDSLSTAAFDSLSPLEVVHGGNTERHELRVGDLESAIPHHFRIRAVDEWGRAGQVSEQLTGSPAVFGALAYLPEEDHLMAEYGEELHFEVRTTGGVPFEVRFSIPPDTTVVASHLIWHVQRVGRISVIATAYAGGDSLTHSWTVHASAEELPLWSPVRSPDLQPTDSAGELMLSWAPPPDNPDLPPLRTYSIAHATDPISAEGFETLPTREVEHVPGTDRYQIHFRDLELETTHYFRIGSTDRAGRAGQLSEELSATPAPLSTLIYLPAQDLVHARYGDELRFEVSSGGGEPHEVLFEVPPDTTANASVLAYRVRRLGLFPVFATIHTPAATHTHRWMVDATADPIGPVGEISLGGSERPGESQLSWSPPPVQPGVPPVSHYEVAHSGTPIPDADFEILPKEVVAHASGTDRFVARIGGLQLGVPHYFRIRAVDTLGRGGPLSEEISGTPSPQYTITGVITTLDTEYRNESPVDGVRVVGSDGEAITDANGAFAIPATWGLGSVALELSPPPTIPPLSRVLAGLPDAVAYDARFLLLPRSTDTVKIPAPTEWSYLRLLRSLTDKIRADSEIAHWEEYPVQVHVPELILGNGVDYGAAMRRGIQKWNEAAGFPVLVESSNMPEVGVTTSYDLPLQGGGLLGLVTVLAPDGGRLYRTVPRKLSLALVEWYEAQGLADRVALHELGHVLYLTHSPSHDHVMSAGVSGSSPNEIHPDEAAVLRTLIHTPNGTRYGWYQD